MTNKRKMRWNREDGEKEEEEMNREDITRMARELLELAAKAAGWFAQNWAWFEGEGFVYRVDGRRVVWNPLTDDGDALRLFYTLPWMCIETSDVGVTVRERGNPDEPSRVYLMWTEWLDEHNGDLAPATRRAITRAAAEIGEKMR